MTYCACIPVHYRDDWCVEATVKSLLGTADEICVLVHGPEITEQMKARISEADHVVHLDDQENYSYDARFQLLEQIARQRGHSHWGIVDADEVLEHPVKVSKLGMTLVEWVDVSPRRRKIIRQRPPWAISWRIGTPRLGQGRELIHSRLPHRSLRTGPVVGRLLHLQYMSEYRIAVKHVHYHMLELLLHGKHPRPARYDWVLNEAQEKEKISIPFEEYIYFDDEPWQVEDIRRLVQKYGTFKLPAPVQKVLDTLNL